MQKIKEFITESRKGKGVLNIAIVVLIVISSFLLGRLSNNTDQSGIQIEYPEKLIMSQPAGVIKAQEAKNELKEPSGGREGDKVQENEKSTHKSEFFASIKGKKYYPAGCSAGKSLKLENRIYFNTKKEAEDAGYALSSSCK